MLRIHDLASRRNGLPVLDGLSLDIPDGQIVLLTGKSGCGKTPLLRILGGLEKYSRGNFVFDDFPDRQDQLRKICFLTGKGTLPPFLTTDATAELASLFWEGFDQSGFSLLIHKQHLSSRLPVGKFSPIERRYVELACSMARGGAYLLLDPSFSTEPAAIWAAMQSVFSVYPDRCPTVLIASSLWEEWCSYVDRAVWISDGRVLADISTDQLPLGHRLSDALIQQAFPTHSPFTNA